MAVLRRRWDQAVSGDGRVVLISREPGIGKSRLDHEIRAHVSAKGGYTRAWQCSPNHAASARFPFVEQAAIAINLTPRDSMADRQRRELAVRSALAPTLLSMHGFSSEEPRQAFQRLRELSAENDDTNALFQALWGH